MKFGYASPFSQYKFKQIMLQKADLVRKFCKYSSKILFSTIPDDTVMIIKI